MRVPQLLVVDETEDLSLQVKRATAYIRPCPDIVWCDSWEAVEARMRDSGPFETIIAGPITSKPDGFQRLRELRAQSPQTQLLLALNHWRGSDLRETVRAGAVAILPPPDFADVVVDSLKAAIGTWGRRCGVGACEAH